MVVEVMHEVMQAILIDDRDGRLRAVATIMRQQLELEQRTCPANGNSRARLGAAWRG